MSDARRFRDRSRKYLVDALLDESGVPKQPQYALTMVLPNGGHLYASQTGTDQHVVALTEPINDGWYLFKVFGKNVWYFYSCEVTNL